MGECQRNRQGGGIFERNTEAHDRAAGHVDGESQPRPSDPLPALAIDHHHIRQCVVDLDDVQRKIGMERRDSYRPELFPCSFGPLPLRHNMTAIKRRNTPDHSPIVRNRQLMLRKAPPDFLKQGCQRRLLPH
jgi:hypothetical protein